MNRSADENLLKCEHSLKVAGLNYVKLNKTHWRISIPKSDETIDVWPTTHKWIDLKGSGKGNSIESLIKHILKLDNSNKETAGGGGGTGFIPPTKYPRTWEVIKNGNTYVDRLKIHGGWLVESMHLQLGVLSTIYIPDPNHLWELEPLPEVKKPNG